MDQKTPTTIDAADRRVRMGERLRQLRLAKGMTLADVASRSNLAISTVSKVERGVMALTYDRFGKLAEGLGVDMGQLFAEDGERFRPGEVSIARQGEYRLHETDTYTYEMLFPDVWGKAMTPMIGTLRPLEQVRFDRFISHAGEEFVYVLEGRVIVHLENKPLAVLNEGESVYLDSRRGHLYASAGSEVSRILVVCTKPFQAEDGAVEPDA